MKIWLENIHCWEPGKGLCMHLEKTAEFDLTELTASSRPAEVRLGPYKIQIETVTEVNQKTQEVEVGLRVLERTVRLNFKHGHGKFFLHSSDVDVLTTTGEVDPMGKAHACFEILW